MGLLVSEFLEVVSTKQTEDSKSAEISHQSQLDGQEANNHSISFMTISSCTQKYLVLWNLVENWLPAVKNDISKSLRFVVLPEILLHNLLKNKIIHLIS